MGASGAFCKQTRKVTTQTGPCSPLNHSFAFSSRDVRDARGDKRIAPRAGICHGSRNCHASPRGHISNLTGEKGKKAMRHRGFPVPYHASRRKGKGDKKAFQCWVVTCQMSPSRRPPTNVAVSVDLSPLQPGVACVRWRWVRCGPCAG